jgi:O-antigen/teichoic acid export membrane protein
MLKSLRNMIGISVIDQTIISGISFLTGIYLAYKLGIVAFGQYSLILLVVQFCIEIQRSTINSPMLVFSAEDGNEEYLKSLYPLQFLVSLFLSLLAGAFIYVSGFLFEKWQISIFTIPAIIFTFTRLQQEFYRRYFFAKEDAIKALIMDCCYTILFVTGLALLKNLTVVLLLIAGSAASFIPLLFFKIKFDLSLQNMRITLSQHYHFSKWLFASSLANYFSTNLLLFIGSAMIGSSAAGIMKLSQYIMGGMVILYQAADNIIPHQLAKFIQQAQINGLKNYFIKYLLAIFAVTAIHGAIIYHFIDPILRRINAGDYTSEQYHVAIGYIIFTFFLTTAYSLQYLLRAYRKTRPIFIGSMTAACVTAITGKALIIHFGLMGILLGFTLSQAIIIVIYLLYSFKIRTVHHANHPYPVG